LVITPLLLRFRHVQSLTCSHLTLPLVFVPFCVVVQQIASVFFLDATIFLILARMVFFGALCNEQALHHTAILTRMQVLPPAELSVAVV
jgi:hypothetical protein